MVKNYYFETLYKI